jgi:hypothetical protein
MGVDVQVRDSGATGLKQRLRGLSQAVTVGVHEDAEPYPDGTSVVMVGAVQEFGSEHVPARSFLRSYADGKGQLEVGNAGQIQTGRVVDGETPDSLGRVIGEVAVAGVIAGMNAGIEGVPSGEARELRDTGHLHDSIDAKQGDG